MKLLENISEDLYKADQENLVLKYLQENKIMGNEDIKDEPNLFHCYWFGQFLPVHLLCIKSLLATQNVDKIYSRRKFPIFSTFISILIHKKRGSFDPLSVYRGLFIR